MLYRITIRPISSFVSKLQSDTFFGAFCWSYKYLFGDEQLESFLEQCIDGKPGIVFSNAYPAEYLPVPLGVYRRNNFMDTESDKQRRKVAYEKNKKYKKYDLIRRDAFIDSQNNRWKLDYDVMGKETLHEASVVHNMVDRSIGTVTNKDGAGNLYAIREFYPEEHAKYDVYLMSDMDEEILKKVCSTMFMLGIGGKKSSGKGAFEIEAWKQETELLNVENPNAFVALSNFIPDRKDPVNGYYRTFVKSGKLDREYANGDAPFKKPLLYIASGALFYDEDVKEYYGKCINNISKNENVVVNACTIAIPIRVQ